MEEKKIEETVNHLTEMKKDRKKQKRKMPKEVSQKIWEKIFYQLLTTIGIMLYFVVLNLAYVNMREERLIGDIKVFAGAFLVVGIVMLEKAYREEKGKYVLTGIESLVFSLHTLSIMHVITLFKYDFRLYLLTSSYIFSIYYVLKSIIIYIREKRIYSKGLSDISEIIKKEEPTKKEATKKVNKEENQNEKIENKENITVAPKKKPIKKGNKKTSTKKTQTKKQTTIAKEKVKTETKKKESFKENKTTRSKNSSQKTNSKKGNSKKTKTQKQKGEEVKEND